MKFSIRDLLLLTVIVALAVGWWIDRRQLQRRYAQERERAAAEKLATEELMATLHVELAAEQIKAAAAEAAAEGTQVQAEEQRLRGSSAPAAP